jgi:hypothetical protein
LYNLVGSGMDRFVPWGCDILQYADEIVVYSSHHVLQTVCALVQTTCLSLSVFFLLLRLTIFSTESKVVLFSRRHLWLPVSIQIGGRLLPQVVSFKYLGVFFDAGLRWGTQARYVQNWCLQRLNFLKSIAGVWWGAHCTPSLHNYVI